MAIHVDGARDDFPLSGIRVLDLTDRLGVAGPRLLAGLGAEVLRIEQPGDDAVRTREPRVDLGPTGGGLTSLTHMVYNAGKQSLVIDWTTEPGRAEVLDLLAGSDIALCCPGREVTRLLGVEPAEFADAHPGTALVLLDPFPAGTPFRADTGEDLLLSATGGFAWLCGDADGPPEHPKGEMASTYSGVAAALAGLAGLTARRLHGRAGWYELSGQESVAFSTAQSGDVNQLTWHSLVPGRVSWRESPHGGVYRCADGNWVSIVTIGGRFDQVISWLREESIGFEGPEWLDYDHYFVHLPAVSDGMAELCSRHPADHLVTLGQKKMIMVCPLLRADQLLADPQLVERGVWTPVAGSPRPLRLPRAPLVFRDAALPVVGAAPAKGEHDPGRVEKWRAAGVTARTGRPRPGSGSASGPGERPLPLAGLRVADFTWMLAAPLATRILADLGADVVRIESHLRRDLAKEVGTQPTGWEHSLDTNSLQPVAAANKRSVALNLYHPDAVAVAERIIAGSDVVVDNFRPGTMAKWGLAPDDLLRRWPELIVASMPAVGSTGPHRHFGAIGGGVAAYAGVNLITGFAHNPPRGLAPNLADFFSPLFGVQGILAALHRRARTGRGEYLDSPMLEAGVWLLDTAVAEYQLLGQLPERIGNRSRTMAPHGFFPCRGTDQWIALAVRSDAEWREFCRIAPVPSDQAVRFARLEARRAAEDDLEKVVAAATERRDRWELAGELQARGVAAAPVEHVGDHLGRDPGMAARFSELRHPFGITYHAQNQWIRPEGRVVPNRLAPILGEHTDEVLRELGFEVEQITDLFASGVLK